MADAIAEQEMIAAEMEATRQRIETVVHSLRGAMRHDDARVAGGPGDRGAASR